MELLDEADDAFEFFLRASTTPAMIPPIARPAMVMMTAKTSLHKFRKFDEQMEPTYCPLLPK